MPDIPIPFSATIKALKPLLGQAAEEIGAMLADEIRLHRWSRQLKILERANSILAKKGITAKPIHLKVLVPLLDSASLEEEAKLEEMWAKLLASASENNQERSFYFICTEILKNISSNEAKLLEWMYEKWETESKRLKSGWPFPGMDDSYIHEHAVKFHRDEIWACSKLSLLNNQILIDNLMRLNLIRYEETDISTDTFNLSPTISTPVRLHLTHLAIKLMQACGPDQSKQAETY